MKLPKELEGIALEEHWLKPTPKFIQILSEAIVRDCARFADGNEAAILARYGLEPKT